MKRIYLSFLVIFLTTVAVLSQPAPCTWFTVCTNNTWDVELAANPKPIFQADSVDYLIYPIDLGDGLVSEVWSKVDPNNSIPINKFFTVNERRQPTDAADFTGSILVLYDVDYLYLLVTIVDNAMVLTNTAVAPASANNDRVEMEIVPYPNKCPGKATLAEQWSYWNNEGAHKMEVNLEGNVGEHIYVGTGSDIAPTPGYLGTQLDLITNATGYQFELGISFTEGMKSSLGLPFPAGPDTSMGFNVAVIDRDPTDAGTYVQAAISTSNNDVWATNLYCGILKFGPPVNSLGVEKSVVANKISIKKNPVTEDYIQLGGIAEGKAVITNLNGSNSTVSIVDGKVNVAGLNGLFTVQIFSLEGALVATEKVIIK